MNLKDVKFPPIHRIVGRFFGRFHVVTFTVVVIGGLAAVTYVLNEIIISSSQKGSNESIEQQIPGFDRATLERVNDLSNSSSEIKPLNLPKDQRTNPFTE